MKDKKIKQIPYGVAAYDRIITKNCYYVDKIMYLAEIENAGDYLFFTRPRRFGPVPFSGHRVIISMIRSNFLDISPR
jgi:hypothetical protein